MKVIDVYPPQTPGKRPTCEGKLGAYTVESNETWQRLHPDSYKSNRRGRQKIPNDQCDNFARYKIGKKWLCRKHAAYALLDSIAERQSPL